MARRPLPLLTDVLIEKIAAEGKSIAHTAGGLLFVQGVVPGDRVTVQVNKRKKGYMEGYVTEFIAYSTQRQTPPCRHFGLCGGCQWQMLPYTLQLQAKQQQVVDQLTRIGSLQLPPVTDILPAPDTLRYRNKLEFTFSPRGWLEQQPTPDGTAQPPLPCVLGFHIPRRYDRVLDIEECLLQPEPSNALRNAVRQYALQQGYTFYDPKTQSGWLRNLTIRITTTGQVMALIVMAYDDEPHRRDLLDYVASSFPQLTSLLWCINPKVNDTIYDLEIHTHQGADYIVEELGSLHFEIGPKSFFQTNSRQAERLYEVVRSTAQLQPHETLYDLYTGTGTIALYMARSARHVVAIESVPEAIEDAERNAARNGITNVSFHVGDVLKLFTEEFVARNGHPDVLITDPPRAGMHPNVVQMLLQLAPRRIVYVSCNPATQARDLALLTARYDLASVQPVDMFPHTKHVENVVGLTLRP